jgi:hypothetical protein
VGGGEDADEGVHGHGLRRQPQQAKSAACAQAQLIQLVASEILNGHLLKPDDDRQEKIVDDPVHLLLLPFCFFSMCMYVVLIERAGPVHANFAPLTKCYY